MHFVSVSGLPLPARMNQNLSASNEKKSAGKAFLPVSFAFAAISLLVVIVFFLLPQFASELRVVVWGNFILFGASALSFLFFWRSLRNTNPHGILRLVYSGMLIRMAICIVAVFIYLFLVQKAASKGGIAGCFLLYMLYTFLEVKILMQLSRKAKNA